MSPRSPLAPPPVRPTAGRAASAAPAATSSATSASATQPLRPARAVEATRPRGAAVVDALLGGPLPGRLARWDTPATTYAVIQGAALLLLALGVVMVTSSASVDSLGADRSPFAVGTSQAVFGALGLVAMLVASRVPLALVRRAAPLVVVVAVLAELAVFSPLGVSVLGNRNWIAVAGFTVQPSEIGKIALAVWCAAVVARRADELDVPRRWLVLLALGVAPVAGVVLAGGDLGTVLVMLLLVAGALFVAGVPLRTLGGLAASGVVLVTLFVVTSANRRTRFAALLTGGSSAATDAQHAGYQPTHGLWGLASGGLTGEGLGGSRQKWDWLPEATSDYIFSIIGEELGLVGTLVVLLLLGVLAWGCVRVVRRSDDLFTAVLVGGVATWVLGQAALNIAVVLKLAPVVGVPLPLISAGGSAVVATLAALGLVLSAARAAPGARSSLGLRPALVRRSLAVVARQRSAR